MRSLLRSYMVSNGYRRGNCGCSRKSLPEVQLPGPGVTVGNDPKNDNSNYIVSR